MAEGAWRRLPVDLYDEDRVLESELVTPDPRPASEILANQQQKQQTVRQLLQRGDTAAALKAGLEDPPYGDGEIEESKALAFSVVVSILNSTKATDISALVSGLDNIEQVTLMKYIYKAMENLGDSNGNVALGWHEKLVEKAGTGCIVRVMTDRKRV
ncbi:arp2/3 complex subunit [Meredithblackwellia eburnea MCA 4105]